MSLLRKNPFQAKAEKYYKSLDEEKTLLPEEVNIEREEEENLLNFLERQTKSQIEKCLKIAMKPLPTNISKKSVINEIISPMKKADLESQIKSPGSITKEEKEILRSASKIMRSQLKSENKIRSPEYVKRDINIKEIESNYSSLSADFKKRSSLFTNLSNAVKVHFATFHNLRTLIEEMKEKNLEVNEIEILLNSVQANEEDTLQILIENENFENLEFNYLKKNS